MLLDVDVTALLLVPGGLSGRVLGGVVGLSWAMRLQGGGLEPRAHALTQVGIGRAAEPPHDEPVVHEVALLVVADAVVDVVDPA